MELRDQVVVLGAGVAGLGFARTIPVSRIFEAGSQPGGHCRSHQFDGVWFDEGTHVAHPRNPDFLSLIQEQTGGFHEIEPSIVANYHSGQWLTYPVQNHLRELPEEDRIQALTDLVMAHLTQPDPHPPDYAAWCRGQYGEFLTERFYRLFTDKYWRMPMEELATDWLSDRLMPSALPRIIAGAFREWQEAQTSFARFYYPERGGFYAFFEPLLAELPITCGERAVAVDVDAKSVSFQSGRTERYEVLASSIPLPGLVGIIKDAPTSVRTAASKLRHTQLLCVNVILNQPDIMKPHWFYAYDADIPPARVAAASNLSPTMMAAGQSALQAEIFFRDDEELGDVSAVSEETVTKSGAILGFDPARAVSSVHPVHVRRAYVISDLARAAAVKHILAWLRERGIFSMGLYGKWHYIKSDAAYFSGVVTAGEVKEYLCRSNPTISK